MHVTCAYGLQRTVLPRHPSAKRSRYRVFDRSSGLLISVLDNGVQHRCIHDMLRAGPPSRYGSALIGTRHSEVRLVRLFSGQLQPTTTTGTQRHTGQHLMHDVN